MYGAIYRCKICGKEFPYIIPGEKEQMEKIRPLEEWTYTPYGEFFPENRILGIESKPPANIPHYHNSDDNVIGLSELIGFKEMVAPS